MQAQQRKINKAIWVTSALFACTGASYLAFGLVEAVEPIQQSNMSADNALDAGNGALDRQLDFFLDGEIAGLNAGSDGSNATSSKLQGFYFDGSIFDALEFFRPPLLEQ